VPTQPRQFRLPDATLAALDRIKDRLSGVTGRPQTRTDAVIYAISGHDSPAARPKKNGKKS
jgi:hypothetical protein